MDMSIFYTPLSGNKNQQLLQAVSNGDLENVKKLLTAGATAFCPAKEKVVDSRHYPPLILAIEQNRIDIIRELIKKTPARIIKQEIQFNDFNTAIQYATKQGLVEILKLLIETLQKTSKESALKTHLETRTRNHYTAFAFACQSGNLQIMEILAKAGTCTKERLFKDEYNDGKPCLNKAAPMILAIINKNLDAIIALVQQYKYDSFADEFLCDNPNDIFKNDKARKFFLTKGIQYSASVGEKDALAYFVDLFNDQHKAIEIQDLGNIIVECLKKESIPPQTLSLIRLLAHHLCSFTIPSGDNEISLLDLAVLHNKPDVAIELIYAEHSFWELPCSQDLKLTLSKAINKTPILFPNALPCLILYSIFAEIKQDDANFQMWMRRSLLKAAEQGLTNIVRYFVEVQKVEADWRDEDGNAPILLSIINNHFDTVDFLISKGVDLNKIHENQKSPLHSAICHQNEPMAMHLISHGANAQEITADGECPILLHAIARQLANVTQLIVKTHPDSVHAVDKRKRSSLMYACRISENIKIIKLLLNAGAEINAIDNEKKTALTYSIDGLKLAAVEELLCHGVNLDEYSADQIFILKEGFKHDFKEGLAFFCQWLRNPQKQPEALTSILRMVIEKEIASLVVPFIRLGAKVNHYYQEGITLLFLCSKHKTLDCFEELISCGADVHMGRQNTTDTLFDEAAQHGNLAMMQRLDALQLEWSQIPSPLNRAVQYNQPLIVKYCIEKNKYLKEDLPAFLQHAFDFEFPEIMAILLDPKFGLNLKLANKDGQSTLFSVAFAYHDPSNRQKSEEAFTKMTDVLIKLGLANPLLEGPALKEAIEREKPGMVSRLLSALGSKDLMMCSEQNGMLKNIAQKTLNHINDFHILFIQLFRDKLHDCLQKEAFTFSHLPQDLKMTILTSVPYPTWYQHRLDKDLSLALKKANSMQAVLSAPVAAQPVLFSAQTPMQRAKRQREINKSVANQAQTFEQTKQQPKKRRTAGS